MRKKLPGEYRIGDIADNGETISSIISQTDELVVYLTDRGKPGFDSAPYVLPEHSNCIRRHDAYVRAISLGLRGRQRTLAFEQLGYATNMALQSADDEPHEYYSDFEVFLKHRLCQSADAVEFLGVVFFSLLVCLVTACLTYLDVLPTSFGSGILAGVVAVSIGLLLLTERSADHCVIEELSKPPVYHALFSARCICLSAFTTLVMYAIASVFEAENTLLLQILAFTLGLGIVAWLRKRREAVN